MNWISTLFLLISIFICATLLKKGADVLSPARVFGFTWSIVFALANLKLSKLQFNWTFMQWTYVLMGPLSLLLGIFIVYILTTQFAFKSKREIREIFKYKKVDDKRLFYSILIVFITYGIGYFIIYLVKGYVVIFAKNPASVRSEYFIFGAGLLIHHMPIIVFFTIVYHLFVKGNRYKKWVLKIIGLITTITYLFLLQRYQLIMISVMVFTLLYYTSYYIRFRTMIMFMIFGLLIIYLVATLRTGKTIQLVLYKTSLMKFSAEYAIFTEPYMYIVMNVENFANAVSKLDSHTFGFYTFDWFFALIQLKYPIKEYFGLIDNPFLFSGYNTYTLFWTLYRDFGVLGISFLPFLCGLLVGSVYSRMRRNPTITLVSFYSIIVFVMVLSFFLSPLGLLWFIYIVAIMAVILKMVCIKTIHVAS
jgi:oligosaccharide repeat unit polymerase